MNKPAKIYADHYDNGTIKTLCDEMQEKAGQEGFDFFAVPHHTSRAQKHGEIPERIYPGPERMPAVEISSKWGRSEYLGNPSSLKTAHNGPAYAQDFLDAGYILGFIAGSDTHQTMTFIEDEKHGDFHAPPGITAVIASELTREAIFGGIKNRRCYAATRERIYLDVALGADTTLAVEAAAQSDIDTIEIIRNGLCVYTHKPGDWKTRFEYKSSPDSSSGRAGYYYARVTCVSGANAWSSPLWLSAQACAGC
jgi:hypothetical protein